jgi:hypothetical protein
MEIKRNMAKMKLNASKGLSNLNSSEDRTTVQRLFIA